MLLAAPLGNTGGLTHAYECVRAALGHGGALPQSKMCSGVSGKFAHNLSQANHFLRPLRLRVWERQQDAYGGEGGRGLV